jgi:hypothetical protein
MRSILERIDAPMTWRQPRFFHYAFELATDDGETLATLHWRNLFTNRAQAACADGAWEFRRTGLFSRRVVIHREGSDVEAGSFTRGFFGGKLEMAGGHEYRIRILNVLKRRWGVVDGNGRVLIRMVALLPFSKTRAKVRIASEAAGNPELPLLVIFSWYHVVHVRHRGDGS